MNNIPALASVTWNFIRCAYSVISNHLVAGRPSVYSAPWGWSPSLPRVQPASALVSPWPERSASWPLVTGSHLDSIGRGKHKTRHVLLSSRRSMVYKKIVIGINNSFLTNVLPNISARSPNRKSKLIYNTNHCVKRGFWAPQTGVLSWSLKGLARRDNMFRHHVPWRSWQGSCPCFVWCVPSGTAAPLQRARFPNLRLNDSEKDQLQSSPLPLILERI